MANSKLINMSKIKLITTLIIAVIGIIIVLQNTTEVETKILFMTITMPRAVLLFIVGLGGFALGVLVSLMFSKKS